MDFVKALKISAAGMRAQGMRLRVLAENIANADSVPDAPGSQPYRVVHDNKPRNSRATPNTSICRPTRIFKRRSPRR